MGAVGLQQHFVIASALDSDVDHAKGWSCGWPLESMIVEAVDYTGEEASSNGEANSVQQAVQGAVEHPDGDGWWQREGLSFVVRIARECTTRFCAK